MARIVEAVGSIVISDDAELSKKLEEAMSEGVRKAMAAGVSLSDREGIRKYQEIECDRVRSAYSTEFARATEEAKEKLRRT